MPVPFHIIHGLNIMGEKCILAESFGVFVPGCFVLHKTFFEFSGKRVGERRVWMTESEPN